MLQLVYDSMTGTVKRFTQQLVQELGEVDVIDACQQVPQREFLLLTYTFGTGEVPTSTRQLLNNHAHLLRGVVSSGSFHWGTNFARAADLISAEYHVPIVAKLNKGGTAEDRRSVLSWLRRMNGTLD
jgi:protein involved in ribonucleotide reduction